MAEVSQDRPSQGSLKTEGEAKLHSNSGLPLVGPRLSVTFCPTPPEPHLGLWKENQMPGTFATSQAKLADSRSSQITLPT